MKNLLLFALLSLSSSAFAQSFIRAEETNIRSTQIGNATVVVLEDFLKNSIEPAKIVAIEGSGENEYALIERHGMLAVLLPERLYGSAQGAALFLSFASGQSCTSKCAGSAIAGAITGGLGGAAAGATTGGLIGTPGGPAGIGAGASAGAVIGGSLGMVGGAMTGYESCKLGHCEQREKSNELDMD